VRHFLHDILLPHFVDKQPFNAMPLERELRAFGVAQRASVGSG
jgi:hypothetical protein